MLRIHIQVRNAEVQKWLDPEYSLFPDKNYFQRRKGQGKGFINAQCFHQNRSSLGLAHISWIANCWLGNQNWFKVIRINPIKAEMSRAMDHSVIVVYRRWCFLAVLKLLKAQDSSLVPPEILSSLTNRMTMKDLVCCVWINQKYLESFIFKFHACFVRSPNGCLQSHSWWLET